MSRRDDGINLGIDLCDDGRLRDAPRPPTNAEAFWAACQFTAAAVALAVLALIYAIFAVHGAAERASDRVRGRADIGPWRRNQDLVDAIDRLNDRR